MENKNDQPPWFGCGLVALLCIVAGILTITECSKGAYYFLSDEGGKTWLLVIGGLALLVFLIYRANRGPGKGDR